MRQFNYYASNVCLTLLKEFVQHACLDEKQKRMVDEVVFAFQYVQEISWGRSASNLKSFDQEAAMRVLNGLHEFATILPFLNKAYIQIDDGAYEDTSGAIAAQILPSLKGYMECVRSFPGYFNRMYPEPKKRHARWNKALRKMEYAFECVALNS